MVKTRHSPLTTKDIKRPNDNDGLFLLGEDSGRQKDKLEYFQEGEARILKIEPKWKEKEDTNLW